MLGFLKAHIRLVVTILVVVSACGLGIFDLLEDLEGLASVNWKEAQGKILSNSIKSDRINNKMVFIPSVVYSYHIGDDAYRGTRITFPEGMPSAEKDLRALLERVAIEHPVTSYYDPKNISHVTLTRGVRRSKYVALFIRDGVIAFLSLLLLLLGLKRATMPQKNFAP